MINSIPVAFIFIMGSFLIPLLKGKIKSVYMLSLPILAFINLIFLPQGQSWQIGFLDYTLILSRVDGLSTVFGYIFILITFIGVIYALHVKDNIQHVAAFCYAGGALGVTFTGDLFSLYFFWELMAVASCFLILAQRTTDSRKAAFRYFMWHFFGGVCLLAGIVIYVSIRGTITFSYIGLSDLGTALIFVGFCLNAAIFPFHSWLPDAYPRATITGAVFMSAMTTKSAVYILARTYPGSEVLMWAGAFMTCFPIFYAVIANDMRRVLSYSLINQVGFMICGIGIGSQLAINGVVAHAFCHIIYKALLFMSMGAVLHMTGKIRATDLGGLYRYMPFTAVFCIIGAASISAFPLFSGFISKSLTIAAVAEHHQTIIYLMLLFASAGVFHHAGIKVPYFVFFGHDSGIKTCEPPFNMRLAMGIAAFICVFLGVYPAPLYNILPFPVDYHPYTFFHVIGMVELLMFGALAFTILILSGFYPAELRAQNLDTDWFFRMPGRAFLKFCDRPLKTIGKRIDTFFLKIVAWACMAPIVSVKIEKQFDKVFHKFMALFPSVIFTLIKPLETESRQISWNLLYILACFISILFFLLFLGG
ncbi:MAG: Na(+)/H(+) antiporter subunit D [Desulfobacula sp.]|jgi:multicomponent Na+:H+ antiporter subunit D|nr:Na(+)/H(+) antiporter subunit D [Desulfobacula sp.]MBT6340169.1 Na(+)/H(+) antiporter subunit D [Desulfobacula sp.]